HSFTRSSDNIKGRTVSTAKQHPFEWGKIHNSMGFLSEDHKYLLPQTFMTTTHLNSTEAAKELGTNRQAMYKNQIPLKPSSKLKERVMAVVSATDVAYELFDRNHDETAKWLVTANILLFGKSPFEVCMRGDGQKLVEWLLDRAGVKPASLNRE